MDEQTRYLLVFAVIGIVAGFLASLIVGGDGLIRYLVTGVIGAFVGGFVGGALFGWDVTGFNVGSIVLAFLGAVIFLLILRAIPGTQPFER